MSRSSSILLPATLLALASGIYAQPPSVSPGGILNHFSYAIPGMPNGSIAQGSVFDIYGTNIGPAELTQPSGFPLPTQLGGTSVQVTVSGTTVDVLLFFVARGQIVGLLPSRTPEGTGTLVVIVNGQRSAPAPITVVARSLGILTLAQNGQGPAVMQVNDSSGNVLLNSVTNSATAGQVGVFYGTGLGRVPFDESRGAPVLNLEPLVLAFVDGKPAKVLFQGRTPGLAGLDQINVEIPPGVSGCYVTVWFETGNVISNLTTISVSEGDQCPDPPSGGGGTGTGTLRAAGIQLVRASVVVRFPAPIGTVDLITDTSAAAFSVTDLSKIPPAPPQISPVTRIGGCIVGPIQQQPSTGGGSNAVTFLDAGPTITIRGPNGVKQLARQPTGYASILGTTPIPGAPATSPPYLSPGTYTVDNGSGGADVPAFSAAITIPEPAFSWTNAVPGLVVQRSQGIEITWSGGDQTGWVDIAGQSLLPRSAGQTGRGGHFSCRVRANAGRFQVTPQILLNLPPSVVQNGEPSGSILVANTGTTVNLPLAGYTAAELVAVSGISRSIEFR